MSTQKKIALLCSRERTELIADELNNPSLNTIIVPGSKELAIRLADGVDAVIISQYIADESTVKALASAKKLPPVAVVTDPQNPKLVAEFISTGMCTFIAEDNLHQGIKNFILPILATGRKDDILLKALNRIKKLASTVHEGIILLDDQGQVSYVNQAAEIILQTDKNELLRKRMGEIVENAPIDLSEISDQPAFIENFEARMLNGKKILLNITCSLNMENGEFAGAFFIFNKVSNSVMDKQKELEYLQYQQRYHSTQQNMAFQKQMLVLKDEVSNIMINGYSIETYFRPLDVLSGDIYGSINLGDGKFLLYIIDAMGKGLSASITSLQSSSFINHSLEMSMIKNDFDINKTIISFLHYIRDRLMEEEALCAVFTILDTVKDTITIANYGMPPVYMVKEDGDVDIIKPNNLPIMRCLGGKNMIEASLKDVQKIVILSDGLIETETTDGGIYAEYFQEHLSQAMTKKHLISMINQHIRANEDDITFFFVNRQNLDRLPVKEYVVNSDLDSIQRLSADVSEQLEKDGIAPDSIGTLEYAMSEILMNALEHGNLGIDFDAKQELIANGTYDDVLVKCTEAGSSAWEKKITLRYYIVKPEAGKTGAVYISIEDEGKGFQPANLFKYHSFDGNLCHVDKCNYNGRGIFITDTLADGLYYKENGNVAYIVKLLEP